MRVVVVTGYVEIPGHPRTHDEYARLGQLLSDVRAAPVRFFESAVENCWLFAHVRGEGIAHATAGNPAKNSLAYHVVQHQKTAWLAEAADADPAADVLVWIDYGIAHQGIAAESIDTFLSRIRSDVEIAIPGAWERSNGTAEYPDWRFLGSSLVIARQLARPFHDAVREATLDRLARDRYVTWEVNDWAEVERRGLLPIRWYQADHNGTQFSSYPGAP